MSKRISALVCAGAIASLVVVAPTVAGATGGPPGSRETPPPSVFVQTDGSTGNQVVAYGRAPDGSLTWRATYATDGLGGQLNGSAVDFLASQGSLAYDRTDQLLVAVNAGSNSISVFAVDAGALVLQQVLPSGGAFPNSVAVSGNLVYVLNARDGGSLAGFRVVGGGRLQPIPGSARALGLTTPTDATEYTHTPGQVAFTPDGHQLLVTTKATSSAIDVFAVRPDGRLSAPVVNVEAGAVPFAVTFDAQGRPVVANAGTNSVSTYTLGAGGVLSPIATEPTDETATCWISQSDGTLYASNAGSGAVSVLSEAASGSLSSPTTTGTDPGTVDSAVTPDGAFLYVQTGRYGIVDGFAIGASGALTPAGSVTVPSAVGGEGIVAI